MGAISSCTRPTTQSAVVANFPVWFINPSTQGLEHLIKALPPRPNWDSLLLQTMAAQKKGPGLGVEILRDSGGTPYKVGFSTPETFPPDSTYPLIIYLHGGTRGTSNSKGEKAYEMLSPLADSIDLFLASPSANGEAPWWSGTGLKRILQTLRFMSLHFPIDPQRVFLAGVSDGATGCYAAANCIPGPFAGFIAVSGFGGLLPNLGMQLFPHNLMQRPIYNVNAGQDRLYPKESVDSFLQWLSENGVYVQTAFYPEEGHGFDYHRQEIPSLLGILRTWRRPAPAQTIVWNLAPAASCVDQVVSFSRQSETHLTQLTARWIHDTLEVQSLNLSQVTILCNQTEKTNVYCRIGSSPVRATRARTMSSRDILVSILHDATPRGKSRFAKLIGVKVHP